MHISRALRNPVLSIFVILLLSACSSSMDSLEKSTTAERAERIYSENYQEIYRRITNEAKRCLTGNLSAWAQMNVEAQLYNELGFGEISLFLTNFGTRNFYWTAKVKKADEGTILTVIAGNTIRNKTSLERVLRWADGEKGCSAF